MKIQDSEVRLSSQHEASYNYSFTTQASHSFRTVLAGAAGADEAASGPARERLAKLFQSLVDAILAAMEGRKCRSDGDDCREATNLVTTANRRGAAPARGGTEDSWQWSSQEKIDDHERTQVTGQGRVVTADGRSIAFTVGLDMCRDYSCERDYAASGKVVLQDPLVINFAGQGAELTGKTLSFDLDADGLAERIPGLASGSAYLVLDRNGNGRVDDGSELFGTRSGNGFADLASLDTDGNGWLDAADPAFQSLQYWQPGSGDKPSGTLASAGVGALWLGSVASPFALKDGANQLLGEIKAAGVFLYEDGRVGSLQQVDVAREAAADPAASPEVPAKKA